MCLALVVLLAAACAHDVQVSSPLQEDPPPGGLGGNNGGGQGSVQRADLVVRVVVASGDAPLAAAVGSSDGVLSQALVTIRLGTQRLVDTTDAAGVATFSRLVPGDYSISVARVLSPQEIGMLPAEHQDVSAFGGGAVRGVRAPSTEAVVEVVAGRRGSLVFREIYVAEPAAVGGAFARYVYGHYLEVQNNADTIIDLTGKLVGRGFPYTNESTNPSVGCSALEPWRLDSLGILSIYFDAFPSAVLHPGESVLLATDAIDHSAIQPGMPNLTSADFEFIGSNDVDNPGVRNMVRVSPAEFGAGIIGHGLMFSTEVLFLADAAPLATLDVVDVPVVTPRWYRIPRSRVLDVVVTSYTPELAPAYNAPCNPMIHPTFDRQVGALFDFRAVDRSIQRRVFGVLPNGRELLLRTRSTANDFELRQRRY